MPQEKPTQVSQPGEVTKEGFAEALGITFAQRDREEFADTLKRIADLEKQADAKAAHVQLH